MVASHVPPTGDWACNPGMCPAGNRTSDPLLCSPALLVLFDSHLKANIPNPVPNFPPKVVFSVESSAILPAAQAECVGIIPPHLVRPQLLLALFKIYSGPG